MADIVTTRIFQDGEKNITAAKLNDIVASSTIQPAFVSSKPSTSTIATTDNLLVLQTAGTYAKAPFQTVIDSVNAGLNTDTEIWKVRLRSFNAIGNSTFEVDQRNAGNAITLTGGTFALDRWQAVKSGTMAATAQQVLVAAGALNLPGTNFGITRSFLEIKLTTAQATLGATDYMVIQQLVEGPNWRELQNDVHSIQVYVRSSVAGLNFGVCLHDPSGAHSLTNLLTIPTANTWTLLTLPNLPVWPAGTFVNTPGNVGYTLIVCLACGSTYTSPANSTWQNGNFFGAAGQSNFAASPVNSTFDIAYISHEPGAVCSTPMDCPFTQNYDACLRYYQKTYPFAVAPGTISSVGMRSGVLPASTTSGFGPFSFHKPMAKTPTMTVYNHATGAAGSVRDSASTDHTGAAASNIGETGFSQIGFTTAVGPGWIYAHYTADTGW